MNLGYNFLAHITYLFLHLYGLFNQKVRLFVNGRKKTFTKLATIKKQDKVVWFHVASLGEFEQAKPIVEKVKRQHPSYKIVITFFSPSGYEVQKDYPLADVICYLPFDTIGRVKKFIKKAHPKLAIFVKYEFWPNLLAELKKQRITTVLVCGIFRENQHFFKSTGGWMRKSLQTFDYFFVQNSTSKKLLNTINFYKVAITGDTRFDRVLKILEQDNTLNFMARFKNDSYLFVAGSTWKEDQELILSSINQSKEEKWVIAPHNINKKAIKKLKNSIKKEVILFSEIEGKNLSNYQVLIVDTVGLLTKIYSYADAVYVGGAFKTGLHNILEPATFGIPIVIGPEFSKFQEAVDLVKLKGCFSVKNKLAFSTIFKQLQTDEDFRKNAGKINESYIQKNIGATDKIMKYINQKLKNSWN